MRSPAGILIILILINIILINIILILILINIFSSDITNTKIWCLCLEEMMRRTTRLQKTTSTADLVGKKLALILPSLDEGVLAVSQRKVILGAGGEGDVFHSIFRLELHY